MRVAAVIVGAIAAACLGLAVWLFAVTLRFYLGDHYAPNQTFFSYSAGGAEADGSGIFLPAILLAVVGIFFLKFALNLWRKP